jgi:hypothetical protein
MKSELMYIIAVLAALAMVLPVNAAAGGSQCNPACDTDHKCVKGECVQKCVANTDCIDPAICDTKKGYCVPNPKACDDGNVCTAHDTTVKGKCYGTPIADDTVCTNDNGNTGVCSNGQCVACEEWQLYCDGSCVNENDPNHCFACDNVCTGNQICDAPNYDPTNNPNPCIDCSTLGTGYKACIISEDPMEVKTCIDTSSDPSNCGDCGNTCGDTESCVDGSCVSSYCSDPTKPQKCTWNFNGVPSTVCCAESDICAQAWGESKAACCPQERYVEEFSECCPENMYPYYSQGGFTCEWDSCINGVLDPGESDVDCGGNPGGTADYTGCYERCQNDKSCVATGDNDCASYYCNEGTCEACTGSTGCHDDSYTCSTDGVCTPPG